MQPKTPRERNRRWLDMLRKRMKAPSPMSQLELADLTRGDRLANLAKIRSASRAVYLGDDKALCRVLGRYKMFVDTTDMSLAPHLMLDGYWEFWVTEHFPDIIRPGMTCVDAGANFGYFTLLMADLAGPEGRVYAFEPNPPIAKLLQQSVTVNGFQSRVTVQQCLLEDRDDAYMQLSIPAGFAGGAAMLPPIPGQDIRTLHMTKRMDSFPELLDADVIKIDAEGAEYAIWKGMDAIFRRNRPLTILIEFVACRYPQPYDFLHDMVKQGLSLSRIDPVSGLVPTNPEQILSVPDTHEFMLLLKR